MSGGDISRLLFKRWTYLYWPFNFPLSSLKMPSLYTSPKFSLIYFSSVSFYNDWLHSMSLSTGESVGLKNSWTDEKLISDTSGDANHILDRSFAKTGRRSSGLVPCPLPAGEFTSPASRCIKLGIAKTRFTIKNVCAVFHQIYKPIRTHGPLLWISIIVKFYAHAWAWFPLPPLINECRHSLISHLHIKTQFAPQVIRHGNENNDKSVNGKK